MLYPAPTSNVVDEPEHIDNVPIILGVGFVFSVTITWSVPVQPFASVTVTEYVPPMVTFIVWVLPLGDHA